MSHCVVWPRPVVPSPCIKQTKGDSLVPKLLKVTIPVAISYYPQLLRVIVLAVIH